MAPTDKISAYSSNDAIKLYAAFLEKTHPMGHTDDTKLATLGFGLTQPDDLPENTGLNMITSGAFGGSLNSHHPYMLVDGVLGPSTSTVQWFA